MAAVSIFVKYFWKYHTNFRGVISVTEQDLSPLKAVLGIGHRQTDDRQTDNRQTDDKQTDRQTEMLDIEPLGVEPVWLRGCQIKTSI